ncbi:transporter substrate-binding domain-containing protein [Allostreptomyces psammosilenae]|uniref:Polar amino acid transport system substrate-binding protein n=1 Tax=Allostreptomyces psammosilenae TaxID=1892865 RepID=A0A853A9C6_9ACTN|nr:transporter substrate-binding domain-containing protein [Allostreptomyces psammosilenae]NYI07221.1 polar amino acid transport system substrate-binding protein [Allostreptomyces psammosilenae]
MATGIDAASTAGTAADPAGRRHAGRTARRRGTALAAVLLAALPTLGLAEAASRPSPAPPGTNPANTAPAADTTAADTTAPGTATAATTTDDESASCDAEVSLRPDPTADGPELRRIRERGHLIAGVDQNSYLFGYRQQPTPEDPTGRLVGFDIDIVRAIAEEILGDPDAVEYRPLYTSNRIDAVREGEVDVLVRTTTISCERLEEIAFSTPYLAVGNQLLVPRDAEVDSLDALPDDQRVCASRDSTAADLLARLRPDPAPVLANETLDCLVMLQRGQVAGVVSHNTLLAGQVAQDPQVRVVGEPLSDAWYGVGVRHDADALLRVVNHVLEERRVDGSWQASYDEWLAPYLPGAASAPPAPVWRD